VASPALDPKIVLNDVIHFASDHGRLGGLGFGAAALQLAAPDRWIGWDVPQRRAHLHRVVGLGRFLIRPSVHCHNLASRVLRLALAVLREDFAVRYGYRPWLVGTCVDVRQVAGTCFRAANWCRVWQTQGPEEHGEEDGSRAPVSGRDSISPIPRRVSAAYSSP